MSENTENTFTAYLGPEFQQRLMWQILVEPEFAEKAIPNLAVEYFDDPNLKRLFLIILEFFKEYEKVPNLQNQSIHQAIYKFKTPNNVIEEESLFSVIKRIELWNERVLNKQLLHDGDIVQKETNTFIRQQEYRKLGEFILDKTRTGDIKLKNSLGLIDEKIQKISHIGDEEDYGSDVTEGVENALRKEFRQTIPTGVDVLDAVTGGGLGKGEIGLILTPSGVGKSTLLTKIANTARDLDFNVLQIIFEDTEDQIKRKHYSIWSGIGLSEIDDNNELVLQRVNEKIQKLGNKGRLTIKKFSQEDTTMKTIKDWILRYQKKNGFKFDIFILDYLDCVESHKKTADRNEAELVIIKYFEALAGDLNIPCWTAIQSGRQGLDQELVEAHHTGGSIKRLQKAHFFMSVGKTPDQKEAHLANIRIIKARFAQDGQTFKDCVFNNNTMQIIIKDDRYVGARTKGFKKYGDIEINKFDEKTNLLHLAASTALPIEPVKDARTEYQLNDMLNQFQSEFINKPKNNMHIKDVEIVDELINIPLESETKNSLTETQVINTIEFLGYVDVNSVRDIDNRNLGTNNDLYTPINDSQSIYGNFEWTGETETINTNIIEVNIDDIESKTNIEVNNVVITSPEILTSISEINENKNTIVDLNELDLIDPDDEPDNIKKIKNELRIIGNNQKVIKIE